MPDTDTPHSSFRANLPFRLSIPENDRLALHIVYALSAAAVVLVFPALVALPVALVKRAELAGSTLESHAAWQVRTLNIWLATLPMAIASVFVPLGWLVLPLIELWLIYRAVKGWLYLAGGRPIPSPTSIF